MTPAQDGFSHQANFSVADPIHFDTFVYVAGKHLSPATAEPIDA
jgi:hypothetical protein